MSVGSVSISMPARTISPVLIFSSRLPAILRSALPPFATTACQRSSSSSFLLFASSGSFSTAADAPGPPSSMRRCNWVASSAGILSVTQSSVTSWANAAEAIRHKRPADLKIDCIAVFQPLATPSTRQNEWITPASAPRRGRGIGSWSAPAGPSVRERGVCRSRCRFPRRSRIRRRR